MELRNCHCPRLSPHLLAPNVSECAQLSSCYITLISQRGSIPQIPLSQELLLQRCCLPPHPCRCCCRCRCCCTPPPPVLHLLLLQLLLLLLQPAAVAAAACCCCCCRSLVSLLRQALPLRLLAGLGQQAALLHRLRKGACGWVWVWVWEGEGAGSVWACIQSCWDPQAHAGASACPPTHAHLLGGDPAGLLGAWVALHRVPIRAGGAGGLGHVAASHALAACCCCQ